MKMLRAIIKLKRAEDGMKWKTFETVDFSAPRLEEVLRMRDCGKDSGGTWLMVSELVAIEVVDERQSALTESIVSDLQSSGC